MSVIPQISKNLRHNKEFGGLRAAWLCLIITDMRMKITLLVPALLLILACPLFAQSSDFEGKRVRQFTKVWTDDYQNYNKEVYQAYGKAIKDTDGTEFQVEVWHGPMVCYREDGTKRYEGVYRHGKRDGLFLFWAENGTKTGEAHWVGGLLNGKYLEWRDGNKMRELLYEKGNIVSEIGWDTKQNILYQGSYKNNQRWEGTFVDRKSEKGNVSYVISTYKEGRKIAEQATTASWWW